MLREYLKTIADAIRSKLGGADKINAQDFSGKVDEVYEKGKNDEHNAFWDSFNPLPLRQVHSNCLFAGTGWV